MWEVRVEYYDPYEEIDKKILKMKKINILLVNTWFRRLMKNQGCFRQIGWAIERKILLYSNNICLRTSKIRF